MYERDKDAKRLAGVLQVQLEHTQDAAERQERMLRIAQILEGDAGDKPLALTVPCSAIRESARGMGARIRRALAGETGNWALLVEAYEAVLPSCRTDALRLGHSGASLREGVGQHRGGH